MPPFSPAGQNLAEALPHARAVSEAGQSDPSSLNTAAQVLALCGRPDEAEAAYGRALEKEGGYRAASLALADLLLARRAFEEVISVCDAFLHLHPTDQESHLKREQALWELGQTKQARDALFDLLDFAPDHVTAHYNLSLFADPPDAGTTIGRLSVLLSEDDLEIEDQAKAWFALGNLHAAQGNPELSLACFGQGNSARATLAPSTQSWSAKAFHDRAETLSASPLPKFEPGPSGRPTPLIISGPSRSGKSLLQAWLTGHPHIKAADETGLLPLLAENDVAVDPSRLEGAAGRYHNALSRLGGEARFVIDTHPVNSLYLDLLPRLCPDAVIIQMHRDPLDLAVSIFARNFVTGGHWADTWSGIAGRLTAYETLRKHWSGWGPVVADVAYEDLAANPEKTLKSVVQSLGLQWTDDVLPPAGSTPHLNVSAMPWASFAGRGPVRSDAVGLWKPFAPWLADFADAYGRDALSDDTHIPNSSKQPQYPLAENLNGLQNADFSLEGIAESLQTLPAVQARLAAQAEAKGQWNKAVARRWQAVCHRPFTYRVRHHVKALNETLQNSDAHSELAALHVDIDAQWKAYRKSASLHFGDYGLPYQSCARAYIAGSRDTETR